VKTVRVDDKIGKTGSSKTCVRAWLFRALGPLRKKIANFIRAKK